MRDIVLMDIDHTLADCHWRDHLIGDAGWDEYHAAGKDDACVPEVRKLVVALANANFRIICLTGRPERWRMATVRWMVTNQIPMHELLMRPDADFRPTPELKVDLVKQHLPNLFPNNIAFIIDNDERIIEKFKAEGVTAMQIHIRRTK